MELFIFDPAKKKQVLCGHIIDKTFTRVVKPEHYMNVVKGYGIQEVAFQEIKDRGVTTIVLLEEATGKKYTSSIEKWLEKGRVADYGHGKQRFISLKYINDEAESQISLL